MKELFTIETECNEKYCPKCGKMYHDDIHKGYVKVFAECDDEGYEFDHEFYLNPQSNVADKCDVCGSFTLRISSANMKHLVGFMITAGATITNLVDLFSIKIGGMQRADYFSHSSITFNVPDIFKQTFKDVADNKIFIDANKDGIFTASFDLPTHYTTLCSLFIDIADTKTEHEWMYNYVPKIIFTLAQKGYGINGSGFEESTIGKKTFNIHMISTGKIKRGFHIYTDIKVTDTSISFSIPPRLPEYMEWVESLPNFEEA